MSNIYIVGAGMTPLGRHLDKSVKQLTALAVDAALADAGTSREAIGAAWFSNTRQGALEGQHGIRGQCALRAYGFEEIPIFNTDNACCSSSSAMLQAYGAIKGGLYDVALVVGTEKMNYPDKRTEAFAAFKGSMDLDLAEAHMQALITLGEGIELPAHALQDSGERSVFMDLYSAMARMHMRMFGTTQRQIAEVAAKNHWHSQWNPMAQYRKPMSVDEVLADKLVSWPMTRSMCAPQSDGAGALVLCSEDALSRFDRSRAIRIAGCVLGSGTNRRGDDLERGASRLAALKAYEMASISPQDVSVAEIHDATLPLQRFSSPKAWGSANSVPVAGWWKAATRGSAARCPSIPPAACCRRVIRRRPPVPSKCTTWCCNCGGKPASGRYRHRGSRWPRMAAASMAARRPR
jgi:acetyl-CoA acyltransferase